MAAGARRRLHTQGKTSLLSLLLEETRELKNKISNNVTFIDKIKKWFEMTDALNAENCRDQQTNFLRNEKKKKYRAK